MADAAARGEQAAHGRRHPISSKARRWSHAALRRLAKPESTARIDALHFVPAVRNAGELADLAARINWYLADVDVPISIEGADRLSFGPADAPHMDPSLVHAEKLAAGPPRGDAVRYVLHRVGARSVVGVLPHVRDMSIADPVFAYTSELGYYRLRNALATSEGPQPAATVPGLLKDYVPGGRALVLGTGPSATEIDPTMVDADIRIVCNSAVRDLSLISALQPHAICFADPVFHFGPSRYAAAFRADLRKALAVCEARVVIPSHYAGLFVAHLGDLADRVVTVDDDATNWSWLSRSNTAVHFSGNVLTYLMLPVALGLADHIEVGGCDGRQASERYFWKHNPTIQYGGDLMSDAFTTHPAFFRTRDYSGYYDEHTTQVEAFFQVAEAAGKTVVGVTRSHIPALVARDAPTFS